MDAQNVKEKVRLKPIEDFIIKANKKHGGKYGYLNANYTRNKAKVKITCNIHGDFEQRSDNHLKGQGCPKCGGTCKLTTEDFIERANVIHKNKYTYPEIKYTNSRTKIPIFCYIHGIFLQRPHSHLKGGGCPECGADARGSNAEGFIKKAKEIHKDKYGYLNVEYNGTDVKVKITCPKHGIFSQRPGSHLHGAGCPKCNNDAQRSTTEDFIEKAKEIHGNKYGYDKVEYTNNKSNVKIICYKHGDFLQRANDHLKGYGCSICSGNLLSTTEDFIEKAKEIHGNKYGYDKVEYTNNKTKVTITCLTHGDFKQIPNDHLRGNGCPKCNNSKGEQLVSNALTKMNLQFKQQFKSEKCQNIKKMPFDFCVKINDLKGFLIEYQGEQHYRPVKRSKNMSDEKAEEILLGTQYRDEMKRVYARKNNIPLLIISYKQKDIIYKLLVNFICDNFDLKHNM